MKENSKQPESTLQCKYCGYSTREDVIKTAFWTEDGLIVVEDVLAQVCDGCAEQFLDGKTAQQIRKLLKNPPVEPRRQIRVSVYDLLQFDSMLKRRCLQSIKVRRNPETNMKCRYCESKTTEKLVKSAFWVNEQLIAIENIPAWVCQECEVHFYDDETAETIATLEQLGDVPDRAKRDTTVSVFTFGDKKNATDKFIENYDAR